MELTNGNLVMYIKADTLMMNAMDTEKCFGLMDQFIEVCGIKEFNMAREEWSLLMALLKKESSKTIFFKGSIPNRLKLYQKRSCNSTSYYSFDKVTNSNSGSFESYSKQYQAMNYGEFNNKKRERNRHNDSFVKINLSSYNIPFMRTKMTTIYQSQKPAVMDT